MTSLWRYRVLQLHMLLAALLLPLALLYFVSGALYTMGVKGHVEKQVFTLQLEQAFVPDIELLSKLSEKALLERSLEIPTGDVTLKKKKKSYEMRWGDLKYAVSVRQTNDPMSVELTYRKRDLLTQLMRIHRAEAGSVFKVLAVMLALGLIVIFASGIYMGIKADKFRRPVVYAIVSGCLGIVVLFSMA